MKAVIHFADLKHTEHGCNAIPYGIGCVAAYALQQLGDQVEVKLFKYPANLAEVWTQTVPQVVCFSNYVWNSRLAYAFAERLKQRYPDRTVIFGGPNFPLETLAQEAFLRKHPSIDFYIGREGEVGLAALLQALLACGWDVARLKAARPRLPNCHYLRGDELVQGPLLSPLSQLDDIPSPYLTGLLDDFLTDARLIPVIQTARGCPFTCTYCEQGEAYFNYRARFPRWRLSAELAYLAGRAAHDTLYLADSNFGMYAEDVEVARDIAAIKRKSGWPTHLIGVIGKNNKERVLETAKIVGATWLSAAVQSTDPQVLKNIRRQNVSLAQMMQVAAEGAAQGFTSFSEVILGLPGDSRAAHFRSIADLIEAGMNVVRSHQFIMLPGSEAATLTERKRFGMVTRFRVLPKTLATYQLWKETFVAPEIDEIVVSHATLSFEDYLQCRLLDLTVEIFYNDGPFQELLKFLAQQQISISAFIMVLYARLRETDGPLAEVRAHFLRETQELWETADEVHAYMVQAGVLDRYRVGELGNNEQWLYRALAIFNHMDELHRLAFEMARVMLEEAGKLDVVRQDYLGELAAFSLLRKHNLLAAQAGGSRTFHYDFVAIEAGHFNVEPWAYARPEGIDLQFFHSREQQEKIAASLVASSTPQDKLINLLNQTVSLNSLYRHVTVRSTSGGKQPWSPKAPPKAGKPE